MSIEDLVSAQADPTPSVVPFTCEHCGTQHRGPIYAAMCCDEISFTLGYD